MSPTQMLRDSYALYKAHWKILTLIAVTPYAFMFVGSCLASTKNIGLGLIGILFSLAGLVFTIGMYGGLIDAIRQVDSGNSAITWKTQYKFGFKLFWPLILLGIIMLLVMLGSYSLFFIPGIAVSGFVTFAMYPLVLDGKRNFSALLESYSVVKGRWWKSFGRLLVMTLVSILGSLIIVGVDYIIRLSLGIPKDSGTNNLINTLLNVVLFSVIGPLTFIYMYKLYNWLKSTRLPDVSTVAFKRWLITFIVVGVLAAIVLPIMVVSLVKSLGSYQPGNTPTNQNYNFDPNNFELPPR